MSDPKETPTPLPDNDTTTDAEKKKHLIDTAQASADNPLYRPDNDNSSNA